MCSVCGVLDLSIGSADCDGDGSVCGVLDLSIGNADCDGDGSVCGVIAALSVSFV